MRDNCDNWKIVHQTGGLGTREWDSVTYVSVMESLVTSWSWEHLGKLSDMMKLSDNPIRPDAWFTTYPVVRYWKCLSVVVLVQERMNQWWETCSQEGGVGNTIHCETDNSTEQSIQYSNLIKTMQ